MTGDREGPPRRPEEGPGEGGEEGPEERPEEHPREPPGEEEGPGGIFPSWRWLYGTVLVWFVVVVVALYVLTVTLDFGAP